MLDKLDLAQYSTDMATLYRRRGQAQT